MVTNAKPPLRRSSSSSTPSLDESEALSSGSELAGVAGRPWAPVGSSAPVVVVGLRRERFGTWELVEDEDAVVTGGGRSVAICEAELEPE